jgi:hypothetical protein
LDPRSKGSKKRERTTFDPDLEKRAPAAVISGTPKNGEGGRRDVWIVALSFQNGIKTRVNERNKNNRAASRKTSLKIASSGLKDGVHFC